jgi:hypothetical protein
MYKTHPKRGIRDFLTEESLRHSGRGLQFRQLVKQIIYNNEHLDNANRVKMTSPCESLHFMVRMRHEPFGFRNGIVAAPDPVKIGRNKGEKQ